MGHFSTHVIDGIALELSALGASRPKLRGLYRGLPVARPSAWSDTWGAPRHEFGTRYRRHQGQDIFCVQDAAVLAVEGGTIEFDVDRLGGRIARLYRSDGSYWYYAHLSRWNVKELVSGARVEPGAEIGRCGTTGNAAGTPAHLHFGLYVGGAALNPIDYLATWLGKAVRHAIRSLREVRVERRADVARFRTERLFGDAFTPRWLRWESPLQRFLKLLGVKRD